MAAPGSFPLLVQGSWGADPPKNLSTKLQVYFQSQKRSGGGECEVRPDPGSPGRFLVLFFPKDVRQNVLERENHELAWPGKETFKLTVQLPAVPDEVHDVSVGEITTKELKTKEHSKKADASEDTKMEGIRKECENILSLVAFENFQANVTDMMLILLVENISGLSRDDFQVEVIRDFNVAVVIFQKYIDVVKFVENCARHRSVKDLQLSPRLLEVTKMIRVENLPPGVDDDDLKCLFENPQNGGGRVVSVEYFPEESSALIEFFDKKELDIIMTKKLDLNNMPLSVFPYYPSLGTALYGKKEPLIKLPAPFTESLDHSLWKFLHKKDHLIEEINEEVRRCHCELTWSPLSGEVSIRPTATLVNQGRQRIKNWKKDASTAFSSIRSRFKVTRFKVDPKVWDTIKNDLEDERILIDFDTLMGIATLAGKSEDVQNIEPQIKELIENTTQKIQREEQSVKEKVTISPEKYSLLCLSGVQEHLLTECSELEIFYDEANRQVCLKGPSIDVYKGKCEIQEKVYTMAQKSIQLPPYILQFLQQVDCAELSKSLFIAQKILAVYELEGTTVLLTGCSSKDLGEAEKQMVSALSYKRIDIEDREVLNAKKWKGVSGSLLKKHNSSSKSVTINEFLSETTAEVIISGLVREVDDTYSSLFDFVEKNTKIERLIDVKPPLVFDYLKAEKKLFQKLKTKKINVQERFNPESKQKGILLVGLKAEVLEGVNILKQARDSVCVKSICINEPGASQFFQDKAWFYRREVKRLHGCFVELLQNKEKEGHGTDGQKYFCQTELAPGVSLLVQRGDLTQFPVQVVVNAANEELRLIGGLSAALSEAAGPELQADCDRIVKKKGHIPPGHAVISKAGKLPYSHVIHAVGPRWKQDDALRCVFQLKKAVKKSLYLAEKFQYQSIAIPAISAGISGFPLPRCAETIVLAIKESVQYNRDAHTLKEIYLVDSTEETVKAFAESVKTIFKNALPETAPLPSVPAEAQPGRGTTDGNRRMLPCPGGLRVLLVEGEAQNATSFSDEFDRRANGNFISDKIPMTENTQGLYGTVTNLNSRGHEMKIGPITFQVASGDITKEEADVIVNSTSETFNLKIGVSKAILEQAGQNVETECSRLGQQGNNDYIITEGGLLKCKNIIHVVGGNDVKRSVSCVLQECETRKYSSVCLPAIGTGCAKQDPDKVAQAIIDAIEDFIQKGSVQSVKKVKVVIFLPQLLDVFYANMKKREGSQASPLQTVLSKTACLFGTVTSRNSGMHEMKIGPITFQVASGDITKEEADVIVNSTSKTFNLKAGVSKAILEQAGQNVETECSRLGQQGNNDYIITEGGLLKCKNIIHVVGGNDVKRSVSCVLQECETRKYSSVCLPAIGTGSAKQDPDKVAQAIIDAIEDFIQKGSVQSMKKVKVVIFLPQLLDVFYANMKKREGSQASPPQTVLSKIASFFGFSKQSPPKQKPLVLEKKTESAVFQMCGENEKCVDNALCWLKDMFEKEQSLYKSEDECIKDFQEEECQKLIKLQRDLTITMSLNLEKPLIKVSGISRDVEQARTTIEEMISTVRLAKEQESRADCISEFVEWQYKDNNTFCNFDKITNLRLEDARKTNRKTVNVEIKNQNYTVDLKSCVATDAKGHSLPVQRLTKSEVEIPAHWTNRKQQDVCLVELQPGHGEYDTVANAFNLTCSNFKLEKIERIQNPGLWKSYQTKKRNMDAKNSNTQNEKQLFHGTDAGSLPHVNQHGFNRSYAGKNAVVYGKGTYFAVNANYSANDTYSRPDVNGKKHMYYARVLTGLYTHGQQSLIVPPPKSPQNPTDLYDTVTDNVQNPSLFVVFYDDQAYPEYLITFTQ